MTATAPLPPQLDSTAQRDQSARAARIAELEQLADFLSDLALTRPDHIEMLYRLADKARAEANKLRAVATPKAS